MIRFLILAAVLLLLAGCYPSAKLESPKERARIEEYAKAIESTGSNVGPKPSVFVDEDLLPEKFKATDYPFIIIDGVKLWLDPKIPGWEESGGGYRTQQFNCPVAWADFGGDRSLCDASDFRHDDENLYGIGKPANIDGDIQVKHLEGKMQIMDGGKWRDVRPGDKLRPSAAEMLIGKVENRTAWIGESEVLARITGDGSWLIIQVK